MSYAMLTKLAPPRENAGLLVRAQLLEQLLADSSWQVAFFKAPAGYGKTVLAMQLAKNLGHPLLWYQLDEHDNDPVVFLRYLVTGMHRVSENVNDELLQELGRDAKWDNTRVLSAYIVNQLAALSQEGLVVVLDDYHTISETKIHSLLQDTLLHLPPNVRFIVTSRRALPFSIQRLLLTGRLVQLGAGQLRFSNEEVAALLSAQQDAARPERVDRLQALTDGWPIAVRLLSKRPSYLDADRVEGTQSFYEYLAEEVFGELPEDVWSFLMDTSVLSSLDAHRCREFLGRGDCEQVLDYLVQQQLFVVATDDGSCLRYHPLFRQFLQSRLGARRSSLLRRAGDVAAQGWSKGEAVEYYLQGGWFSQAADLIEDLGGELLHRGHWYTLARWLEAIPETEIKGRAWLTLYMATVESYRGRWEEVTQWLALATNLFEKNDLQEGLWEVNLLQAKVLRSRGHLVESLAMLQNMGELDHAVGKRFDYPLEKSLVLFTLGRFTDAAACLQTAIKKAETAGNGYVMSHLLEGLADIYFALGEYAQALKLYRRSAAVSPDRVLPNYQVLNSLATINLEWGELEQAYEYARRAVAVNERLGLDERLAFAYMQLGSIHTDRGELTEAVACHGKAEEANARVSEGTYYASLNLAFWAHALCLQGKWIEARAKLKVAMERAKENPGFIRFVCQVKCASVLLHMGEVEETLRLLDEALPPLEKIGFRRVVAHGHAIMAVASVREGNVEVARDYAARYLHAAARMNLIQDLVRNQCQFEPVLRIGMEDGCEVTFVQRILVMRGQRSLPLLAALCQHPNPQVRLRTVAPLRELKGPEAERLLAVLAADSDKEVLRAARNALGSSGLHPPARKAENHVCFHCLGYFAVSKAGTFLNEWRWRSLKARDLVLYLIHRGEPVSKDVIIEELWPDVDAHTAHSRFHTVLYYLREALHQLTGSRDQIEYRNGLYYLKSQGWSCDWQHFEHLLQLAETATESTRVAHLEEAVGLYRGDYLGELEYVWVLPRQEGLRHQYVNARLSLARHYLQTQEYERCLAHLKLLQAAVPLCEEAYYLSMLAYMGSGDSVNVKGQYDKLSSVLRDELGIRPSPRIEALYRKFRQTGDMSAGF